MRVGLFVDAYIPEINGVVTSTKTLCDALINNDSFNNEWS